MRPFRRFDFRLLRFAFFTADMLLFPLPSFIALMLSFLSLFFFQIL